MPKQLRKRTVKLRGGASIESIPNPFRETWSRQDDLHGDRWGLQRRGRAEKDVCSVVGRFQRLDDFGKTPGRLLGRVRRRSGDPKEKRCPSAVAPKGGVPVHGEKSTEAGRLLQNVWVDGRGRR